MAYESKFKREDMDELFDAVLTLEDREDCYRFFEDICTINELHAISQRLQVAKLLSQKKTYSEIEELTISFVQQILCDLQMTIVNRVKRPEE